MSTTKAQKNSVTAALAVVAVTAPAMLFLGAGPAHAATWLNINSDPLGVTVTVNSTGSSGHCEYTAIPLGDGVKPLPVYKYPFELQAGGQTPLWFPGIPTGTTWNVTVFCDDGTLDHHGVIY